MNVHDTGGRQFSTAGDHPEKLPGRPRPAIDYPPRPRQPPPLKEPPRPAVPQPDPDPHRPPDPPPGRPPVPDTP